MCGCTCMERFMWIGWASVLTLTLWLQGYLLIDSVVSAGISIDWQCYVCWDISWLTVLCMLAYLLMDIVTFVLCVLSWWCYFFSSVSWWMFYFVLFFLQIPPCSNSHVLQAFGNNCSGNECCPVCWIIFWLMESCKLFSILNCVRIYNMCIVHTSSLSL